ncbi:FHA domain-containing protein [Leifsonia sp. PS1209]|uniref:FHA domain-containing protein n=1 Tax=Leifsonia sp. PS1209 TaxID=2724914 RepID=UPI001442D30B|nr:FHA domain-containing protein [Leifsonia sp. PS1209]QIZ98238.1 FHA domain-containing protein [Leifsonia sp. PS1209]
MSPGYVRYAPVAGPSRWLLIAGRRFVAAVESSVADSIVDTVWWLADSELATIESVVGAFPLVGQDAVRSFAVAELSEPNAAGEVLVTAVVRGTAAIDVFSVGGSRRFSAAGVQPWVLAEFRSVTGLVIGGDDLPTGPVARLSVGSLPVGLGVVDGELLTWTLSPIERVERTAPGRYVGGAGDAGSATASTPSADADDDALFDETIIRARRGASIFAREAEPEPAPAASVPAGHELPGAVDIEPPSDTPGPFATPITGDADAQTQPVILPPAPAQYAIRLASGEVFDLDLPVLIGRRPSAPRIEQGAPPRLVAVASPEHEVSSTHVRIEQEGDAVVVTDLRSTNGTIVTAAAGTESRLRPGQSVVVLAGATVEIGDGNIIEITAVGQRADGDASAEPTRRGRE